MNTRELPLDLVLQMMLSPRHCRCLAFSFTFFVSDCGIKFLLHDDILTKLAVLPELSLRSIVCGFGIQ